MSRKKGFRLRKKENNFNTDVFMSKLFSFRHFLVQKKEMLEIIKYIKGNIQSSTTFIINIIRKGYNVSALLSHHQACINLNHKD
jgi:hypothetical protein